MVIDFALKHFDRLAGNLGIDKERLQKAIDIIRSLNPKPGGGVGESEADDKSRHIIPDFNVDVDGDTVTLTLVNNIPDLEIEKSFVSDGGSFINDTSSAKQRETRLFISRKRDEAADFIELLKLRQQTLYKVMSSIVKYQHDFFVSEDETHLRPMILKDIAKDTGYDISVISRATSGKYVSTPIGIYPLKFFFNENVGGEDETSSREIFAVIRQLIESEDPHSPLSDDAIMTRLVERGYEIARRTVTKYREKLGFPIARMRKEI